jgi:hypothetical protein
MKANTELDLNHLFLANLTKPRLFALLLTCLVLLFAWGCGGSSSEPAGNGTLAVRLADAPDPTITAINITVPRVEAHVDGEWVEVATPNQTYNLLDLVTNDVLLGQASLPAGSYSQIRLFVSEATVTDSEGTHNVTIPSAAQTGIKLNVSYTIEPNQVTELLLDFNVDKSLIKQGNGQYRLQPVIPVVVKVLSGTITGAATDGTANLQNVQVVATYTAGSSYPVGTEVNTSATMEDGAFKVWALLPGTYRLNFSYDVPESTTDLTAVVADVEVSANQNTDVGTVTLQ